MTDLETAALAERMKREAKHKVSVRLGRTNGRPCVHVNDQQPADASRSSFTLYSEGAWSFHDLNRGVRSAKVAPVAEPAEKDDYPKQTSVSISRLTPEMAERLEASRTRPVVSEDG